MEAPELPTIVIVKEQNFTASLLQIAKLVDLNTLHLPLEDFRKAARDTGNDVPGTMDAGSFMTLGVTVKLNLRSETEWKACRGNHVPVAIVVTEAEALGDTVKDAVNRKPRPKLETVTVLTKWQRFKNFFAAE